MSWYARTGPRHKKSGDKFQSERIPGTVKHTGEEYRGWFFSFVAHQTGSGVTRKRYAATILDRNKHRVAYLRDCSSIQQATEVAKHWIDETIAKSLKVATANSLGTIPELPVGSSEQSRVAQEK